MKKMDSEKSLAATIKKDEFQPPLVATFVNGNSHLGQPRAW